MALSGTITNVFRTGYDLRLIWSATQDTINNQSTVTARMYLRSLGSSYTISSTAVKYGATVIDGSSYPFSGAGLASLAGNQDKLLFTCSKVITHNDDGTRNFNLSGTFDINVDLSPYVGTITLANTLFTLDNIPRMSLITNFGNITMAGATQNLSVTTTSYSSTYNLDFTLKIGATTIATWNDIVANGGSQSHTLSLTSAQQDAIMGLIPNSTTATMVMSCQTQSSTTNIGTPTTLSATATVGTGIIPTLTSVTATEKATLGGISLGANRFLQTISDLILDITGATGIKGSTIAGYSINIAGRNYTTVKVDSTGGLNVTGTQALTATVTDSRGRTSSTVSTSLTFLAYTVPNISLFTVVRADTLTPFADNPIGTTAKINYNCSVSTVKPVSTELNTLTYSLESKLTTSGTYTNISSGAVTVPTITRVVTNATHTTYLVTGAYDFRLTITDKVGGVSKTDVTMALGKVAMSWGVDGIGVGKVITQGVLDVLGDSYFDGAIYNKGVDLFKLIYPVGAIYMSVVSTSPATLFGGAWAVWGTGRVPVGIDTAQTEFDTIEETGGAKTHALSIAELASHNHTQNAHSHLATTRTTSYASGTQSSWRCMSFVGTSNDYAQNVSTSSDTATNIATGSGTVHNNLQPYITCYMWKRTA